MVTITQGTPYLQYALNGLLDGVFGSVRFRKTAYRLRDKCPHIDELWFVALSNGQLLGSIQYWPIDVVGSDDKVVPALLLGPIAVSPALQGQGIGQALIETSLAVAVLKGHQQVILVGDAPYYNRLGFSSTHTRGLTLPGPYDPDRLLSRQIAQGAELPGTGCILPAFTIPAERKKAETEDESKPGGQQWNLFNADCAPGVVPL